jgi:4-amino-4-deoxy-L-arabinose transferase-like glycosyltransferase
MNIQFTTKPYLPTLVISAVLFIMVFLPWATFMGFSANGTEHGGGVLTLIFAIIGAGVSFLANQKYRVYGTIGTGIVSLIGIVIAWADLGGASVGVGLIIAFIAALGLLALGYWDYRKMSTPSKPAPPPPANPPPPPPPQQ